MASPVKPKMVHGPPTPIRWTRVSHEPAASLQVRAGVGLPTADLVPHGALLMIEGRLARAGGPIDRVAWIGRAWTLGWLVVPLPILYHRPFLAGVVWPLIGMPG